MDIQRIALLSSLTIKQWTGRIQDKTATREVIENHGANESAGKFHKQLVSLEEIKKIKKIAAKARTLHYRLTMPWDDSGARLLPAKVHLEYKAGLEDLKAEYQAQVDNFLAHYSSLKLKARNELGSLYRESDYPTAEELTERFYFEMRFFAVPKSTDFRVSLRKADAERIRADIERRTDDALRGTQLDLLQRLYKAVAHMADKLRDSDGVFRDSLTRNIDDVCALIPKLNVTRDPEITRATDAVRDLLSGLDPVHLREVPDVRAETAKNAMEQAASISRLMGGYTGASQLKAVA